jgi:hypothetical protein
MEVVDKVVDISYIDFMGKAPGTQTKGELQ